MDLPLRRADTGTHVRPVPIDWAAVESWLGLRLPADYKAIAGAHGPLDLGDFVWLHVPCRQDGRFDYGDWLREQHRWARISSRQAPPFEPPPFHPAPGGLLAWGYTRMCDLLLWDTAAAGDPDRWPVVVFHADAANRREDPWHHLGIPLRETLSALVTTGIGLRGGGRIGPLPATARRTAFLTEAVAWIPPLPAPRAMRDEVRRQALAAGTGLDTLSLLVPPPDTPFRGEAGWPDLFAEFGTSLPAEYVALMDRYGGGMFGKWLQFATPLRAKRSLAAFANGITGAYRSVRDEFPEYCPLPVWPEPGGFLPFASSIDGDSLAWLVDGDPDRWPLVVVPRHRDQGPPLAAGLTELLLAWLRGHPAPAEFPALDPLDDPLEFAVFEPWTADAYM